MIGMGALVNAAATAAGGVCGHLFGRLVNERQQDGLCKVCGVSTLFIGIAGAMQGMLKIGPDGLTGARSMFVVICLALGALIGEMLNIERWFERFGEWLKLKTGNAKDPDFVNGFVTASLTVCIGAMAIVGSIQDGILGDPSILATKSVLDFIIVMVMTCSLGKGCAFSAIPILALEGGMTLLARLIQPVMTDAAMGSLSMIGSILIFCVGLNLVWGKRIRVANLLPAVALAVAMTFLPFGFLA